MNEKRVEQQTLPKIGQQTPDGIFIGQYEPKDSEGKSLGKIFNAFAAPEDLDGVLTYIDTKDHIASLKNWYGFDGADYATAKDFVEALKDNTYTGGWVICPFDLLAGEDFYSCEKTKSGSLLAAKNKGVLKGSFKKASDKIFKAKDAEPAYYWSSTEERFNTSMMLSARLSDGDAAWGIKDFTRMSCRPVRLVALPIAAQ